jgi:hypothetical protein
LGYADAVLGIHINMFLALPPSPERSMETFQRYKNMAYTTEELKNLERTRWFAHDEVRVTNLVLYWGIIGL